MILSDVQIKEAVANGTIVIEPFDLNCIQPATYDLHLDYEFKIFRPHQTEIIDPREPLHGLMERVVLTDGQSFILHPGCFALGLIQEKTGVNNAHVGRLEGKSSLARLGLIIHTTAGFLDPGNCLKLTLELYNASPLPIKLYPGMKIAQIAFEQLAKPCERPYGSPGLNSKYFQSTGVEESKMYLNFTDKIIPKV